MKTSSKPAFYFLYIASQMLIFGIALSTPYLISEGVPLFTEEQIEVALLGVTLFTFFSIDRAYRTQVARYSGTITDMTNHVGILNRQVSGLESVFDSFKITPTTKRVAHKLLISVGTGLLNVVSEKWVSLRVVATARPQTLAETIVVRGGDIISMPHISNKQIASSQLEDRSFSVVASDGDVFRVYCVVPSAGISTNQRRIVGIILNALSVILEDSGVYEEMTSNATKTLIKDSNKSPEKKI